MGADDRQSEFISIVWLIITSVWNDMIRPPATGVRVEVATTFAGGLLKIETQTTGDLRVSCPASRRHWLEALQTSIRNDGRMKIGDIQAVGDNLSVDITEVLSKV